MANRPKQKMPVSERAKQFMPFAALKGLSEALAAKEKIVVPRIELSEDMAEELNRRFYCLEEGKRAEIVYYSAGEYIRMAGLVAKIDIDARKLQIVNKKIPIENIVDISVD